MALKAVYNSQDDIPESFRELYTERDGKWELTGIEGVKTEADTIRLQSALEKERKDHKITRDKLAIWGDLDHDQVLKDQDELDELRSVRDAGGGDSASTQEKIDQAVEATLRSRTAPLERDIEKLRTENGELKTQVTDFQHKETVRTIGDAVRKVAGDSKIIPTAVDDVLMLAERIFEITDDGRVITRDGVGVTPGIAPDTWLSEMQERRPHWWPASQGGGANGGGQGNSFPKNPFSREHWNMTEQGRLLKTDHSKAERMAQAAGTTIGGPMPVGQQQQQK